MSKCNNCNYCKSANKCSLAKQFHNNGHCKWFRLNFGAASSTLFDANVPYGLLSVIGRR